MCTEIKIDGTIVDTMGELIDIVGKENIVIFGYYTTEPEKLFEREYCLCPVDIEATALNSGYKVLPYNFDDDDWFYGPTLVKDLSNDVTR